VVHEGEVVPVKVIRIEPERRRLGLSVRQARAEAEEAETAGYPMVYGGDPEDRDQGQWMGGARVIRSDPSSGGYTAPDSNDPSDQAGRDE
jgi:hypothetical protein